MIELSVASTWLIALRTAMVSIGLLASTFVIFFLEVQHSDNTDLLFISFAFLFLVNALVALWSKNYKASKNSIALQLGFDALTVGGILLATGGSSSPFVFLFILLQIIATIFLSKRRSIFLAIASSGLYWVVICASAGVYGQIIPQEAYTPPPSISQLFLYWTGFTTALVFTYLATNRLRDYLLKNFEMVNLSRAVAESFAKQLSELVNGLPEAVIAVDKENSIQAINSAAAELFGNEISSFKGNTLSAFSDHLSENHHLESSLSDYDTWDEFTLFHKESKKPMKRLVLHKKTSDSNDYDFGGTFYIFQDVTQLRSVEEQLALQEKMARVLANDENTSRQTPIKLAGFIGESTIMKKLFQLIDRVSSSDATVLVVGESGTGKELVAKAIHLQSTRSDGPFIPVNCGAIPEALLESELFGHKKGAFTDASSDHNGLFLEAHNGTIFLDEIGEMPLHMQAKLLRTIQDKVIRPVGSSEEIQTNVRIIAATNRDLKRAVSEETFREDLFYRLNVINMKLPPLRERKEDIPLLIQSIVKRLSQDSSAPIVPPNTLKLLMEYNYPGNVRELENIIERSLVIGGEAILPEHLPETVKNPVPIMPERDQRSPTDIIVREDITFPIDLDKVLQEIEQHYLQSALSQTKGVKKNAAELLGMNFRSFRYRLQKFGMAGKEG